SQPAAGLRPPGRPLQLGSDVLVRPGCGLGLVPRTAIGVGIRVGRLRERRVQLLPVWQRCRPVDRRADQRMPEPHLDAKLGQPRPTRSPPPPPPPPRAAGPGGAPPPPGPPATPATGHGTDRPPPTATAAASPPAKRPAGARSCPRSGPPAAPRLAARTRLPAP